MRAALVGNRDDIDPGFVGRSLRQRGYSFVEFSREDWEQWPSLEGIDLLVCMGSAWSTYWEEVAGPVQAEQRLITSAHEAGIPILGICFGAQQLATALGGEVKKAKIAEIGWKMVEKVPETAQIAPEMLTKGPWMQWHGDAFTVPAGATVLADSPAGPQIIVCGTALGLQFHPEATESIVSLWSSGEGQQELAQAEVDPGRLMAETRAQVADSAERCDQLVHWFVTEIAQRHIPHA